MRRARAMMAACLAVVLVAPAASAQTSVDEAGEVPPSAPRRVRWRPVETRPMPLPRIEFRAVYEHTFVRDETAFNGAASLWGFEGIGAVDTFAAEAAWHAQRWLRLGTRFAHSWGTAGYAYFDGARLDVAAQSLGAFVGAGTTPPRYLRRAYVDFAVRLEADAVLGETWLRGESQASPGWRVGTRAELGVVVRPIVMNVFLGYQFLQYGSGGPTPVSFEGVSIGTSVGVRL